MSDLGATHVEEPHVDCATAEETTSVSAAALPAAPLVRTLSNTSLDEDTISSSSTSSFTEVYRQKKVADMAATLDQYEKRILTMPRAEFADLHECYLSTFDCYSNILRDVPNSHHMCNHAVVLMRIARRHSFNVFGVTSERKNNGKFCVDLPDPHKRGETRIVYVGKYNYFTKNRSSRWRLLPHDYVYIMVHTFRK